VNKLHILFLAVASLGAHAKDGGKSHSSPAPAPYCAPSKSYAPSPAPSPAAPAPAPVPSSSPAAQPAANTPPVRVAPSDTAPSPSPSAAPSGSRFVPVGKTTGHPLTWQIEPLQDYLPPDPVIARPEPEVRIVEVPGPERIVEVPVEVVRYVEVPVERTVNVCPVEAKPAPAKRRPLVKPSGVCK